MVYRLILPEWRKAEEPTLHKALEGEFTEERLQHYNKLGYNCYFLPNYPSIYNKGTTVDGSMIDVFRFVFVDFDLKSGAYPSKEAFQAVLMGNILTPTFMVDSGNGVHAYWEVADLDAMSFLRLGRRLMRKFNTDPAVQKIYQLMRVPGTVNTKIQGAPKDCSIIVNTDNRYTCEQLDTLLPQIAPEDEEYCQHHWNKTYAPKEDVKVNDTIPTKFRKLLKDNKEVQKIWKGDVSDRSAADYRLGHLLLANGFSKEEAMSVLVNTGKAATRAPGHRVNYALQIVDKVWAYEDSCQTSSEDEALADLEAFDPDDLSQSVQQILDGDKRATKGQQIQCYSWIDNTKTGFCLGHVIGLVAGVKVGKTILGLNMTKGFVSFQPDMDHLFVALEQPAYEIAKIWKKLCIDEPQLWKKLRVISNYNNDGSHRQLSLADIEEYAVNYQKKTGRKLGSIQIDHIGALKMEGYDRFKPIEDICHRLKPFAIRTNTLLIIQSHAPREKAAGGDLELNQDAAYGTQRFEAYVDWLITMWQPLKKAYGNKVCPKITAFKLAAMRHKDEGDVIQEGVCYRMAFVPATGGLREMTQSEEASFDFFNKTCINKRKQDRKSEVLTYTSVKTNEKVLPLSKDEIS